jgi:hypothetical protein
MTGGWRVSLTSSPWARTLLVCATAWLVAASLGRGDPGDLAFSGYVAEGGIAGCTAAPSLDGAIAVAISPDGGQA